MQIRRIFGRKRRRYRFATKISKISVTLYTKVYILNLHTGIITG